MQLTIFPICRLPFEVEEKTDNFESFYEHLITRDDLSPTQSRAKSYMFSLFWRGVHVFLSFQVRHLSSHYYLRRYLPYSEPLQGQRGLKGRLRILTVFAI